MSGRLISLTTTAEVALTAATAKTVLQLRTNSGTNLPRALIKRWWIAFDGTSTVAEPVVVKLLRQTTDGTGTGVTPVAVNNFSDTILSVGSYNFTAEPTASDVLEIIEVHPQSGYSIILPLGLEIVVAANTRLGIVATAPAGVNCLAGLWAEE